MTNPWIQHVKKFRTDHPDLEYKQVLIEAKKTYHKKSGEGITHDVITTVGKTLKKNIDYFKGVNFFMPNSFKLWLHKYYDVNIARIQICREPLHAFYINFINMHSRGQVKKNMKKLHYDDLFHTFFRIQLQGSHVFRVDRNQRLSVKVSTDNWNPKDTQVMPQFNPNNLKLGQLFENYKNALGGWDSIIHYDPVDQNCQKFLTELLHYSGLLTPARSKFINQDIRGALAQADGTKEFVNLVTSLGLIADIATKGFGMREKITQINTKNCKDCSIEEFLSKKEYDNYIKKQVVERGIKGKGSEELVYRKPTQLFNDIKSLNDDYNNSIIGKTPEQIAPLIIKYQRNRERILERDRKFNALQYFQAVGAPPPF